MRTSDLHQSCRSNACPPVLLANTSSTLWGASTLRCCRAVAAVLMSVCGSGSFYAQPVVVFSTSSTLMGSRRHLLDVVMPLPGHESRPLLLLMHAYSLSSWPHLWSRPAPAEPRGALTPCAW